MMNRVRNAHAWAALLLLAAACGDGGGKGDDGKKDAGKDAEVEEPGKDAGETPDEDTGVVEEDGSVAEDGGDLDGGTDGMVVMDGDVSDTGPSADTGAGGGSDGGGDAGTDSGGSNLPTGCAEAAIVAATGGNVVSSDMHFRLDLAAAGLSADSTVRVCLVPAATTVAGLDGRQGDAYVITTTGGATFSGTATFSGHSALPVVDATPTFDALTVRALPSSGTLANGTGAVLRMSKRTLAADTASRLSATVSGPGHVFVAMLEAAGVYRINMNSPTKTAYVTGEIIDFGTTVTVTGSPVGTRTFEAEVNGCDLDPLNYTPQGAGLTSIQQPGAVRNNASCSGNYVAIKRVGGMTTSNIVGSTTGTAAALAGGTTLDMQTGPSTPLGLYCRFPGAAKGAARLFFKTGTTTDLEIVKDIEVTCTYSGDLVAVYDEVPITRASGAGYVVGTTYTPRATAAIAPPITFTTLAPDALTYPEPAAILSGSNGPTSISGVGSYDTGPELTPTTTPTNTVTFNYATDRYTASLTNANGFYEFRTRAKLRAVGPGGYFECFPPASGDLGLQISDRNGSSSTIAITDGTIDLLSIRVRVPGTTTTIVQRLVDASKLARFQAVPFLTAAQQTAVSGTPSEYAVGFYRVVWDEERKIWDGGRIVPVACGTVLMFEAADVTP